MFTLFKHIYTTNCGYPEYNIALLGLEKTGKTQIYKALKDPQSTYMVGLKQEYKPTVGLNTTEASGKGVKVFVWDLGGKPGIRKIWESYYPYCHGIVYLFDERVEEGLQCLQSVLIHQQMAEVPLLILIRNSQIKQRIQTSLADIQARQALTPRQISIELLPHSRGQLWQSLRWLYSSIRELDSKVRQ